MRFLVSVLCGGVVAGIVCIAGSRPSAAEDNSWWDNPEWWGLPAGTLAVFAETTTPSFSDADKYLALPSYGRGAAAAAVTVEKFKLQEGEQPTTRPPSLLRRRQTD